MSFSKKIALGAASLLTAISFCAEAQTIHVGTEPTFAPFGFVDDSTSQIVGFDIDIINAIGEAEGIDVVIDSMQFDGLIPAVLANSIDAAISGMTKNPEREKMVLFSDPYYVAGQDLMIRKEVAGTIHSMNDLEGKGVCVQIGSVGAVVADTIKGANIKSFNNITEAYMELKKKGCEGVITGTPANQYYLKKTNDQELAHVPESVVRAADLGIITNKNNTELMNKINSGLKKIKENGVYDKLYKKWFN
ncbi:MAG: basic amino acid ABC transporter substrate-binding protein [Succinivibrio sp.]